MTQHASLSPERWATFSRDQQLLMIANELSRASSLRGADDLDRFRRCYERALRRDTCRYEAAQPTTVRK